ncbi:MAG: phasin family protein [Pseudomonadota bacterium]|nr:phasin family protein [Gammaproteobacteria bacterium]MDQ3583789.1 phasin family protein [Pseudomonadota bacterium]
MSAKPENLDKLRDTTKHAVNITSILVHGAARMLDIQTSAAKTFLEYQAKAAAVVGAPEWSNILKIGHNRFFESTADKTLNYMRQTSEAIGEMQSELTHLIEEQTAKFTQELEQGLEEAGALVEEGFNEGSRTAEETAKVVKHTARESKEEVGRQRKV